MDRPITDLCYDYFDAAAKMDILIKKCTKEIKEATEKKQFKKSYYLKQKRLVFYSQKRDLMETAYRLQNYYRKGGENCERNIA